MKKRICLFQCEMYCICFGKWPKIELIQPIPETITNKQTNEYNVQHLLLWNPFPELWRTHFRYHCLIWFGSIWCHYLVKIIFRGWHFCRKQNAPHKNYQRNHWTAAQSTNNLSDNHHKRHIGNRRTFVGLVLDFSTNAIMFETNYYHVTNNVLKCTLPSSLIFHTHSIFLFCSA